MDSRHRPVVPIRRPAFTLIELLVVILIIIVVSVIALPTIIPAVQHRQSSEAARILQGALVGARDQAIHDGAPSGIRLLPDPLSLTGQSTIILPNGTTTTAPDFRRLANGQIDPTQPLAYNRIVPLSPAPDYSEGGVSVFPDDVYPPAIRTVNGAVGVPCLVLEEAVYNAQGLPNSPTSWFWNIRVGDQIQVNHAGPWYTIVGPMVVGAAGGNSELFVNVGAPGTQSPLSRLIGNRTTHPEYLLLVNGRDDGSMAVVVAKGGGGPDGYIDSGFDGIDNDGNGVIDDAGEWETERWLGGIGPH